MCDDNFPEPQQIPEALYGAVPINNTTGKGKVLYP